MPKKQQTSTDPEPEVETQNPSTEEAMDDILKGVDSMFDSIMNDKNPKPVAEEPELEQEEPEVEEPEVETDEEDQPPAKPAKKEKKPTEPEPARTRVDEEEEEDDDRGRFDADELARAISQGNEELIRELSKRDRPRSQPDKIEDAIPEPVKKRRQIYDKLAEMFPDKYESLTQRMADFYRKEQRRADAWEEKNGTPYNSADEEHNDWYEANMPKIDPEDQTEARIELRVESALNKVKQENSKEVESVRKERKARDFKERFSSIKDSIKEPMAKVFDEEVSFEELKEKDRAAYRFLSKAVDGVVGILEEAAKLDNRIVDYDPNNPIHQQIGDVLENLEAQVAQVPKSKRVRDGKNWATRKEWTQMSRKKQDEHWIITEYDIRNAIVMGVAEHAKNTYNEMKELFGDLQSGGQVPASTERRTDKQEAPGFLKDSADSKKPVSPSLKARTHVNAPAPSKTDKPKSGVDMFTKHLLGG